MKNKFNRGFTLIELLVVIAIIGVLSAVVLASLNTARSKGANAAVKSNLANIRVQAEIFFDSAAFGNGTYSSLCTNTKFAQGVTAAHTASGATGSVVNTSATTQTITTTNCRADSVSWSVSTPLKVPEVVNSVTRNYWCVDYIGTSAARANPSPTISPFVCPST